MLLELVNDPKYHVGKDMWECEWHIRINQDGIQDYTREHNLTITKGGKNLIPLPWDEKTGLKYNPMKGEK